MDENREPVVNTEQKSKGGKTTKIAVIVAAVVIVCLAAYFGVTKVVIPNKNYNAAVSLMNEGKYEEAIAAFEALDGYKDSAEQITACETAIKDNAYDAAVALMDEGKYEEAIAAFEAMEGYKDSDEKAESIQNELNLEQMKAANVGDYITFGKYEQDNDKTNGKENIEWLVLEKEGNKIFVISKYILDVEAYSSSAYAVQALQDDPDYTSNISWESSSIRIWLNETFLSESFNETEQSIIQTTKVTADSGHNNNNAQGNDTEDKIFFLSLSDANKYFESDEARICATTNYVIGQRDSGRYGYEKAVSDDSSACSWWLRTSDSESDSWVSQYGFAMVGITGKISSNWFYGTAGVRPALWIDLDA